MAANEKQIGGTHYKTEGLQHWDIVYMFGLGYFEGQATKYLFRWRKKGGVQDLKKAIHYIEKLIEIEENTPEEIAPAPKEYLYPQTFEQPYLKPETEKLDPQKEPLPYRRSPRSDERYTYEGGTATNELFRCKQCGAHFETPIFGEPSMYHYHQPDNGQDANPAYVKQ